MGQIDKGVILSLSKPDRNGNYSQASVQSTAANGTSTMPLTIPWWLRGHMAELSKGTEVVYAVFDDATGIVLSRMDGDWDGVMDDAGLITVGDIISDDVTSLAITAESLTAKSVVDSNVELHSHTHTGVVGGDSSTGKPNIKGV